MSWRLEHCLGRTVDRTSLAALEPSNGTMGNVACSTSLFLLSVSAACGLTVLAFDVDGTIETSAGPITVERLEEIQRSGAYIYIVSPSAARPKGFPIVLPKGGGSRQENLRAVRAMHPDEERFIYVSDNGDISEAQAADFEYVWHKEF